MTLAGGRPARARSAFTLIEIMAVVVIFALIAGVVISRVGDAAAQAARDDGKQIAATVDFARGQAIALGRAHRVVLDLDHAQFWVEAQPLPAAQEPVLAWAKLEELPLIAPRREGVEFAPLTGRLGAPTPLRGGVAFAGVESDSGDLAEGIAAIEMAPDGATAAARIWLVAGSDTRVTVDVAALADPTRVGFDAAP